MKIIYHGASMTIPERDYIAQHEEAHGCTFTHDMTELALLLIRAEPAQLDALLNIFEEQRA